MTRGAFLLYWRGGGCVDGIDAFVRAFDLIDLAVLRGDEVLWRGTRAPYDPGGLRLLFSMTKSFSSLAAGIAADEGLFGLDNFVADRFADALPAAPHPNLFKMRIYHLLTMTTGIDRNTYAELFPRPDWVRAFLAQDFPCAPGTRYRYSTHASHMLSALIQRTSGESLEDFLNARLFHPMGICEARWEKSPEGLTAGGMGLSLRVDSLVKIARLLLNRGVFAGRRLISADYLARATSAQVDKGGECAGHFAGREYGFQFHVMPGGYRMDGAFGQFLCVYPDAGRAVVATSRGVRAEPFLALAHRSLLSADGGDAAFPAPIPAVSDFGGTGGAYLLDENPLGIRRAAFGGGAVALEYADGTRDVFGPAECGRSRFAKDLQIWQQEHRAYARREPGGALVLTVYYIETPYVARYRFRFPGNGLEMAFSVNLSLTLRDFVVRGTREPEYGPPVPSVSGQRPDEDMILK